MLSEPVAFEHSEGFAHSVARLIRTHSALTGINDEAITAPVGSAVAGKVAAVTPADCGEQPAPDECLYANADLTPPKTPGFLAQPEWVTKVPRVTVCEAVEVHSSG